ncbi:hypothetical protein [Neptuniibacter sp. QD37_11]|uniref:hypothetical protein n=1 Tax=Neptuniibacter sp. QD37_11 TaxID=3398209 RepID=UPI0039F4F5FD
MYSALSSETLATLDQDFRKVKSKLYSSEEVSKKIGGFARQRSNEWKQFIIMGFVMILLDIALLGLGVGKEFVVACLAVTFAFVALSLKKVNRDYESNISYWEDYDLKGRKEIEACIDKVADGEIGLAAKLIEHFNRGLGLGIPCQQFHSLYLYTALAEAGSATDAYYAAQVYHNMGDSQTHTDWLIRANGLGHEKANRELSEKGITLLLGELPEGVKVKASNYLIKES